MKKKIALLALSIAFFLFLLLSASTLWYTTKPSFCKLCHEKNEYLTLEKSPHKNINCLQCHQDAGILGFLKQKIGVGQMVASYLAGKHQESIKARVRNNECNKCHATQIQKTLAKREIRISHKEILAGGAKCVECHNTVAHGAKTTSLTYPHMDSCSRCHNGEKASTRCTLCHLFAASPFRKHKPPTERTAPWAITHGKSWKGTHGMGNLATCQICHENKFCIRCHQIELPHREDFPAVHGRQFLENAEVCDRCHNRSFCRSCHKIEMPHPKGFLKEHSKQTKKIGKEICSNCHIPADCDECHVRHTHPGKVDPKYFKMKE